MDDSVLRELVDDFKRSYEEQDWEDAAASAWDALSLLLDRSDLDNPLTDG